MFRNRPGSETIKRGVIESTARRYNLADYKRLKASPREHFAVRLLKIGADVEAHIGREAHDVCRGGVVFRRERADSLEAGQPLGWPSNLITISLMQLWNTPNRPTNRSDLYK
jgi:Holliday junction resolvasome RuvABC endonuclease subunit